jgi:hypothetical protein
MRKRIGAPAALGEPISEAAAVKSNLARRRTLSLLPAQSRTKTDAGQANIEFARPLLEAPPACETGQLSYGFGYKMSDNSKALPVYWHGDRAG